ncbi:MAG: MarR family winged helix-turn-helix transcriptional regulator [Bilifractor sp.]|jgi:DNA-binding MarR family transcriptional regulator
MLIVFIDNGYFVNKKTAQRLRRQALVRRSKGENVNKVQEDFLSSVYRFHRLRPSLCMSGTSRGKMYLLGAVWQICRISGNPEPKVRVSDLVARLGIPAPGVSRILKSLEEEGVVVRGVDPSDRRTTLVSLTEKGRSEVQRGQDWLDQLLDSITSGMGEEKVRTLSILLNELYDQVELVLSDRESGSRGNHSGHAGNIDCGEETRNKLSADREEQRESTEEKA